MASENEVSTHDLLQLITGSCSPDERQRIRAAVTASEPLKVALSQLHQDVVDLCLCHLGEEKLRVPVEEGWAEHLAARFRTKKGVRLTTYVKPAVGFMDQWSGDDFVECGSRQLAEAGARDAAGVGSAADPALVNRDISRVLDANVRLDKASVDMSFSAEPGGKATATLLVRTEDPVLHELRSGSGSRESFEESEEQSSQAEPVKFMGLMPGTYLVSLTNTRTSESLGSFVIEICEGGTS